MRGGVHLGGPRLQGQEPRWKVTGGTERGECLFTFDAKVRTSNYYLNVKDTVGPVIILERRLSELILK